MGMVLGLDGKSRAVAVNTGDDPTTVSTLYLGLLSTLPSNYDGLSLSALVTGNEFTPSGTWYTGGRLALPFAALTADQSGAIRKNSTLISWANTSGSDKTVAGCFVTNIQSGTSSGLSLWVGTPDVGSAVIPNGESIQIAINGMFFKVD